MRDNSMISLLLAAAFLLTGCSENSNISKTGSTEDISADRTSELSRTVIESSGTDTVMTTNELFEFDPHLYVPSFSEDIPQDYWESFYNLCDALRAGDSVFECSSEEAYNWATSWATLNELFPAACLRITGESNDGSVPFENGTGRIYYQMPVDEFVARESEFEKMVTDIINSQLECDDTAFEKCLKLYDYIESNFTYEDYDYESEDGSHYYTLMNKSGLCAQLAGVYSYLLMQAGVEAVNVGCYDPSISHSWTYIIIDGKGYHSDPTWGLKQYTGNDLALYYFLMTDERREESGCPVSDLNAQLLPEYWESRSNIDFSATDESLTFPAQSFYERLDEENKIMYYDSSEGQQTFSYS
ncbi:MAG: transglutaminase domain-containing protein [Clostridiales bacterium]|nr:transglutaminase domain-containing protein [Clostridiales bacterium]